MPQFTLRRLFLSITLITVGCGMLALLFSPSMSRQDERLALWLWFAAGPLIGSGILSLWNVGYGIVLGTVVGFAVQFSLLIALHTC